MTAPSPQAHTIRLPDPLCPAGEHIRWLGERYLVLTVLVIRDGVVVHQLVPVPDPNGAVR